jgi:hypothetical protein
MRQDYTTLQLINHFEKMESAICIFWNIHVTKAKMINLDLLGLL